MRDLTWLIKQIPFIFSASFLLAKWNIYFSWYFLQPFSPVIFDFQSRVGWLFCENNQKWPKAKHCFDNFASTDTFESRDSNERFWQIFTKVKIKKKKYEDLKYLKCCLDLQKREFYLFIKVNLYLYLVREGNSPGRIQAAPLSWLNFVTSHLSKTNKWIIIVTNYQTWASKLRFLCYIIFWISDFSTFKT